MIIKLGEKIKTQYKSYTYSCTINNLPQPVINLLFFLLDF
jgi:hypothetical protein